MSESHQVPRLLFSLPMNIMWINGDRPKTLQQPQKWLANMDVDAL